MTYNESNISRLARVEPSARIWDRATIRERAYVGENVIIGQGAYVGVGVHIASESKIQNNALIYEPAHIGFGVFVGPGAVLTNDRIPRAVNCDLSQKGASDWFPVGVTVLEGASIGAGAICVAPITIGRWAMVAAGAVVTRDVPDFGLVAGNPSRQMGWVGRSGARLHEMNDGSGRWKCPHTGERYLETGDGISVLEV